jgi:membrane protease YdiL (CAAX protease family)
LVLGVLAGGPIPELLLLQQWWLIPIFFVVGFIPISTAVREEFGWRGYALEHLQSRWSALVSSVVLGIVWTAWHLPLMVFPTSAEAYARIPIWVFFVNTVAFSILMTWLYNNNAQSIFTALLFHILIDVSPQIFPFGLTDFGVYINMLLNLLVVAVIVVRYRPGRLIRAGG